MSFSYRSFYTAGLAIFKKCINDRCTLLAAALSFSSLFSLIPFFAILFAIFKALAIDVTVTPLLLSKLTAGSQEVVASLMRYIHNTNVASLGVVGFALVLVSIATTLDTVEDAFNTICCVAKGKAAHHKVRDYLIVIVCIPLCIAVAITLATTLQHQGVVQWLLHRFGVRHLLFLKLIPFASLWIGVSILYYFIPNAVIRSRHAVFSAGVTTLLLQIIQWGYIHFQLGVSGYNAIYGTLALLPVFMVWIYTSWVVVLLGMELVWWLGEREKEQQLL